MQVTDTAQSQGASVPPLAIVTQSLADINQSENPSSDGAVASVVTSPAGQTMKLKFIQPGRNPRRYFDPTEMAELTASVVEHGVTQPILIRPVDDHYEIIAGERRYRAALAAHGDEYDMPVVVRACSNDEADVLANIENTIRANMSPMEEACSAARIVGSVKGDREEAARLLSWSRSKLDSRLALMNCSDAVGTALNERKILLGHAELLASLAKDRQDKLIGTIIEKKTSVAEVKALVEQVAAKLEAAIFDKADCNGCPHNSTLQASMFEESIADGSCTNPTCYKEKTENALQGIAASLKDEYPVIRIIRVGDNSTLQKLTAEGPGGVGVEQAEACRSCKDFGAAVSGLPQGTGKVYKDQCFDTTCNTQKVAARIKAEKDAAAAATAKASEGTAAAKDSTQKTDAKSVTKGKDAAKAEAPKTTVNEGDRVKAYREKVWRAAMKKEIAASDSLSAQYLIALCLNGDGRNISSTALSTAFNTLAKVQKASTLGGIAAQIQELEATQFGRMTTLLAVAAIDGIEVNHLRSLAKHHGLDLTKHWKLNKEFLDLLTKSEIEVIAKSVGLDAAIGESFKKLFTEKKDDLVTKLLGVQDFNYSATIPAVLAY